MPPRGLGGGSRDGTGPPPRPGHRSTTIHPAFTAVSRPGPSPAPADGHPTQTAGSVWLLVGPRGWLDLRLVPLALVLPLLWVAFTLVRGAVIDQDPYTFVDVVRLGLVQVLLNVGGLLVLGVAVAASFCLLDRALTHRGSSGPRT